MLTTREASAHVAILDLCRLLHDDQATYGETLYSFDVNLRAFRARCPVATCRRVLTASPWRDGRRSRWCRCGWHTFECSIELVPAVRG